jgi:hypothetical protein
MPTQGGSDTVVTAPGGFVGTLAQLLEKKASENIGQIGGRRSRNRNRNRKTRRRRARRGILKRRYGRTRVHRRVKFIA